MVTVAPINPLNAQLNPICQLLALLVAHRILHVSRIGVTLVSILLLLLLLLLLLILLLLLLLFHPIDHFKMMM
jgi:hypothetical protein